jgi:hypothetical protein
MAFRTGCVSRRCWRRWLVEMANTAGLGHWSLIKFRNKFEIGDARYLPHLDIYLRSTITGTGLTDAFSNDISGSWKELQVPGTYH